MKIVYTIKENDQKMCEVNNVKITVGHDRPGCLTYLKNVGGRQGK